MIVEILLKLLIIKTPDESLKITTKPNQIDDGRVKLIRKDKTMVTGTQIRNLAFDMNEIGLDIHDNDDIKEYIERLEESLKTAKFCLSKDAVVNTATL